VRLAALDLRGDLRRMDLEVPGWIIGFQDSRVSLKFTCFSLSS